MKKRHSDQNSIRANMRLKRKMKTGMDYVTFMGPAIVLFTVIFLYPLITELLYSFTNWNGIDPSYEFVGFAQYAKAFKDATFWASMWFTIRFAFVVVLASNLIGFFWAFILSKDIPFRNFFRAIIYVPRVIGGVVLGYLWRFIFQNVFPKIGELTGISWLSQTWFSTASSSFWALAIVMIWSLSGYLMIIYGSGLASIDKVYTEAAHIDGANGIQRLFRVTIPMLRPTITRCLFIAINWAMLLYDTNISLTNGNPFRTSEGVTLNIFLTAFSSNRLAFGAAKSMIFVVVVAAISISQFVATSRKEVQL
ncbi:MAG: sugar ABC transporter permease [Oscillospiraceae bacterium]|nr:sugar ABC transporter permease [Oscillospiraceae bacterium]